MGYDQTSKTSTFSENRHIFRQINMHCMHIFDLSTLEMFKLYTENNRLTWSQWMIFFSYLYILSQEPVNKIPPKTQSGQNIIVEMDQLGSTITLKCSGQASPPPVFR